MNRAPWVGSKDELLLKHGKLEIPDAVGANVPRPNPIRDGRSEAGEERHDVGGSWGSWRRHHLMLMLLLVMFSGIGGAMADSCLRDHKGMSLQGPVGC